MSIKVKLGVTDYTVPKMNIGQIEDLSALDRADPKWPFLALAILMRRAEPKVEDVREIEAAPSQISEAIDKILSGSGYKMGEKDPNGAAPEATPGRRKS